MSARKARSARSVVFYRVVAGKLCVSTDWLVTTVLVGSIIETIFVSVTAQRHVNTVPIGATREHIAWASYRNIFTSH